ncbi:MAG: Rieske (2Fe-2S) protein [Planctomycetia bacterium]|nr:Rieske (2Fe-2S) protein [Planctomycetia bacterium]
MAEKPSSPAKRDAPGAPRPPDGSQRRDFLTRLGAIVVGAVAGLVPLGAAAFTFFDPLRKKPPEKLPPEWIAVAAANQVPDDGFPRRFEVVADLWDQWTFIPQQPIGAVFLIRNKGESKPTAFNVTCPHLGCAVVLAPDQRSFKCPCHNSAFDLQGVTTPDSPSPRAMDELETRISQNGQIEVKYENYYAGIKDKLAKR